MATRPKGGFGVPDHEVDPQHFIVSIAPTSRQLVVVTEDFGISGPKYDAEENRNVDQIVRCKLDARLWRRVAVPLRNAFNERLKSRKMPTGRWEVGDNRVHRLFGREMCVLLWAIESANLTRDGTNSVDEVAAAINAWTGLRPEERWWLYAMAAFNSGKADDREGGWRLAIRYGLTRGSAPPDAARDSILGGLI